MNFISVKGPELLSMYVGESERGAARRVPQGPAGGALHHLLRRNRRPGLGPLPAADSDSGVAARVLSQLLTELDGIEELKGVFVLAATNRPDLLDPALLRPGRFDIQLELPLPDRAAREKIFQIHLRDRPVEAGTSRPPGWPTRPKASAVRRSRASAAAR